MWGHKKFLTIVVSCITQKRACALSMTSTPQSRLKFLLLYTILKSFQRFFSLIYILYSFFIIMYIFWYTFIPYYNIVHREVDKAFVSSGYLKSQSFFILIPDGGIRPAPPK